MRAMYSGLVWGPLAFAWFFVWVVLLDALRPDYYFAHKAVSELGALGAPYMWAMNLFGFVGTGAMLMLFARAHRAAVAGPSTVPSALLALTGLLFALTAVPIAMGSDGDPDRSATITRVHLLISQVGLLPWLLALLAHLKRYRQPRYRGLAVISLFTLIGFIAAIALFVGGVGTTTPGLMQRIWFAIVLGWFAAAGFWLAWKRHALRDNAHDEMSGHNRSGAQP